MGIPQTQQFPFTSVNSLKLNQMTFSVGQGQVWIHGMVGNGPKLPFYKYAKLVNLVEQPGQGERLEVNEIILSKVG